MTSCEDRAPPLRKFLGTVALEEAVQLPDLKYKTKGQGITLLQRPLKTAVNPPKWEEQAERIVDIHGLRLQKMNECGVEFQVLSLTSPGPQGLSNPEEAQALAARANDYLAQEVKKNPKRFAAFAALSMHNPVQAAEELKRAVKVLGLVGAILNDFQQADNEKMIFYDQPEYDPFWATVQELDVPVYIHPRWPITPSSLFDQLWKDRIGLIAAPFQFAVGVTIHVLGLAANGVFDRFPRVQVVIGHLGELAISGLWRFDHWQWRSRYARPSTGGYKAKHLLRYYFTHNIHITTSGNFSTATLVHCMTEIGSDRIMYSIDYPYEEMEEATEWFERADISPADKLKIGRTNAIKLLKLPLDLEFNGNDKPYFKGGGTGPVDDWHI